ncbi:unnamed protein product [Cuscuta campestris]|uniref:Endonuclease/exonuclease/phosphatase domain-containing protein n=1 Tax=Cuscuta campestris TaxID=132261 RepID=A0A484L3S8_9ASTE|nr:unnamed protein product [Cuscuta campestris]
MMNKGGHMSASDKATATKGKCTVARHKKKTPSKTLQTLDNSQAHHDQSRDIPCTSVQGGLISAQVTHQAPKCSTPPSISVQMHNINHHREGPCSPKEHFASTRNLEGGPSLPRNLWCKGSMDDLQLLRNDKANDDFLHSFLGHSDPNLEAILEIGMHSDQNGQEVMETSALENLDIGTPKVWIFWDSTLQWVSTKIDAQIVTLEFQDLNSSNNLLISTVYGKHTDGERLDLWDAMLEHMPADMAWFAGGDFNIIASLDEHKGSSQPSAKGMADFNDCILACGLNNINPSGGIYTWSGRRSTGMVWRRLNRVLLNFMAVNQFEDISLSHLSKSGSDHKPLILKCLNSHYTGPKMFRFLNCWLAHNKFLPMVKEHWESSRNVNGMIGFANKLKKLKGVIRTWSKDVTP